jgi:hypothetical protein
VRNAGTETAQTTIMYHREITDLGFYKQLNGERQDDREV